MSCLRNDIAHRTLLGEWEVGEEHTLSTEELARDVQGLGANDDDLLTLKELLGHDTGQTAKEMALAVDDDL